MSFSNQISKKCLYKAWFLGILINFADIGWISLIWNVKFSKSQKHFESLADL